MRRFSVWKAIKNDRVNLPWMFMVFIFIITLALNLVFKVDITGDKMKPTEPDFEIAIIEVIGLVICLVIIIIRILNLKHFIKTGCHVTATLFGKEVYRKNKTLLNVTFELDSKTYEESLKVQNGFDLDLILEKGETTLVVKKNKPKRAIVLDLFTVQDEA